MLSGIHFSKNPYRSQEKNNTLESVMAEGQSKLLNGADTAWLRMDSPTNLMIINAMLITESMRF